MFIFLYLFVASSAACGIYFLFEAKSFIKNSLKAKANIVDIKYEKGEKTVSQILIVKFKDQHDTEISGHLSGNFKQRAIGESVDILYLKSNPQKIKVNNFFSLYFLPIGFIFLAFMTLSSIFTIQFPEWFDFKKLNFVIEGYMIYIFSVSFFAILGIYVLLKTKSVVKNSSKAKAIIVDIEKIPGTSLKKILVNFKDQYGKEISSHFTDGIGKYKKGESVDIFYLKSNSYNVKLDSFRLLYGPATALFAFAAIMHFVFTEFLL